MSRDGCQFTCQVSVMCYVSGVSLVSRVRCQSCVACLWQVSAVAVWCSAPSSMGGAVQESSVDGVLQLPSVPYRCKTLNPRLLAAQHACHMTEACVLRLELLVILNN